MQTLRSGPQAASSTSPSGSSRSGTRSRSSVSAVRGAVVAFCGYSFTNPPQSLHRPHAAHRIAHAYAALDEAVLAPNPAPPPTSAALPPPNDIMYPEGNSAQRRRIELALLRNEIGAAQELIEDERRLRALVDVRRGRSTEWRGRWSGSLTARIVQQGAATGCCAHSANPAPARNARASNPSIDTPPLASEPQPLRPIPRSARRRSFATQCVRRA